MANYSNAFMIYQRKQNLSELGFSPLVQELMSMDIEAVPEGAAFDALYEQMTMPETLYRLTRQGNLGSELTKDDLLSALQFFLKGSDSKQETMSKKVAYELPKLPPVMSMNDVEDELNDLADWDPVQEMEFNGDPIINTLNWTKYAVGKQQWAMANGFGFLEELLELNKLLKCNGTFEGLINTIRVAQEDSNFQGDLSHYFDRVCEKLPLRKDVVLEDGPWSLKGSWKVNIWRISYNKDARAGVPFSVTAKMTPVEYGLAMKDAQKLYRLFQTQNLSAEEVFDNLIKFLPYLMVCRLANKTAVYNKLTLKTKTRPYYIYPAAMRLFGSYYYQPMKDRVMFLESIESESMLGFSWFHGGASQLLARIVDTPEDVVTKFYYSDDMFVFIRRGHHVKMCSPDFSHMDGSLRKAHFDLNTKFDQHRVDLHGGNAADKQAVKFLNDLGHRHLVAAAAHMIYLKRTGLSSGHANTTGVNQTVSAVASCVLDDLVEEMDIDFENFEELIAAYPARVLQEVGLIVKPGTTEVRFAKTTVLPGEEFPLNFLGQNLGCLESMGQNVIVPHPTLLALLRAYVFAPGAIAEEDPYATRMARCIGICLSGGFYFPRVYDMLAADFNGALSALRADKETKSTGLKPEHLEEVSENFDVSEQRLPGEVFHPISLAMLKKHNWNKKFASRDWFIQLFSANPVYEEVPADEKKKGKSAKGKVEKLTLASLMGKTTPTSAPVVRSAKDRKEEHRLQAEKENFLAMMADVTDDVNEDIKDDLVGAKIEVSMEHKSERKTTTKAQRKVEKKQRQGLYEQRELERVKAGAALERKAQVAAKNKAIAVSKVPPPGKVEKPVSVPKPTVAPAVQEPVFSLKGKKRDVHLFLELVDAGVNRTEWLRVGKFENYAKVTAQALKMGAKYDPKTQIWTVE